MSEQKTTGGHVLDFHIEDSKLVRWICDRKTKEYTGRLSNIKPSREGTSTVYVRILDISQETLFNPFKPASIQSEEMGFYLYGDFDGEVWHLNRLETFLNETHFDDIHSALQQLLDLGTGHLDQQALRQYLAQNNRIINMIKHFDQQQKRAGQR